MLLKKSIANLNVAECCCNHNVDEIFTIGASRAYYAVYQKMKSIMLGNKSFYEDYLHIHKLKDARLYSHKNIYFAIVELLKNKKIIDEITGAMIVAKFQELYHYRIIADYDNKCIDKKTLEKCIDNAKTILNKLG